MTLAFLTSATRKFLIAGGLVASLGAAMPATAAETVQFGFSIGNGGNGLSLSLGNGGYNGRHFNPPVRQPVCLTDRQMSGQLRAQGYHRIAFGGEHRGWVHASAQRNGRAYEFDVNRCTGDIANLMASGRNWGGYPSSGFHSGDFGYGFGGRPDYRR